MYLKSRSLLREVLNKTLLPFILLSVLADEHWQIPLECSLLHKHQYLLLGSWELGAQAWIQDTLVPVLSHAGSHSRVISSDHIILIFLPASNTEYNLIKKSKSSNLDTERNQAWKRMGKQINLA